MTTPLLNPIYGKEFENCCDFNFLTPHIQEGVKNYIIYSATDHFSNALEYIESQPDYNFVLVTHNSDHPATPYGRLPSNLIHWYAQNLTCSHPKLSPVPIGLENQHWHPSKTPIMAEMKASITGERRMAAFAQFNPQTNQEERMGMLTELNNALVDYDWIPSINGKNFRQYVRNLLEYRYCLCPRGNGIDTHRIWEALYMGCIPVVKRHKAHEFKNQDLPILFVDNWADFKIGMEPESLNFESDMLSMSYWTKKIRSHF